MAANQSVLPNPPPPFLFRSQAAVGACLLAEGDQRAYLSVHSGQPGAGRTAEGNRERGCPQGVRDMEQREAGSSHPHFCPVLQALKDLKGQTEAIPCVVGDEEVWTSDVQYQLSVGLTRAGLSLTLHPGLSLEAHRLGAVISACKGHCPLPEFEFCGCKKLLESEGAVPGPFLSHVHSKDPGKGVRVPHGFFP